MRYALKVGMSSGGENEEAPVHMIVEISCCCENFGLHENLLLG